MLVHMFGFLQLVQSITGESYVSPHRPQTWYTMTDADIYHVAGQLSKVKVTLVYKIFVSDQKVIMT